LLFVYLSQSSLQLLLLLLLPFAPLRHFMLFTLQRNVFAMFLLMCLLSIFFNFAAICQSYSILAMQVKQAERKMRHS